MSNSNTEYNIIMDLCKNLINIRLQGGNVDIDIDMLMNVWKDNFRYKDFLEFKKKYPKKCYDVILDICNSMCNEIFD